MGNLSCFSYQSGFFGEAGKQGDIFHAEFAKYVFAVFVYCVGLDAELSGNGCVAFAVNDHPDDDNFLCNTPYSFHFSRFVFLIT
jgi:hypothetical protein